MENIEIINNSNSKEKANVNDNVNIDIEKDNINRFSDILKGNSYKEMVDNQKEFSNEHDFLKDNDDTTNSHIIDDINSSIIDYKEMNKVCNDMSLILYKSNFIYNIKDGEFKIKYGNNIIKEYKELIALVNKYKQKIFELFENFTKLIKFLEKAREEIKKGFKNESGVEIKLNLYTQNAQNESYNNDIKNIMYSYEINKNEFKDNYIFQDNNILNNDAPINLQKFISYTIEKIKINKIWLEYKDKRENNQNSNLFFTIISKNLEKSNEIIKISNDVRYMGNQLLKGIIIKLVKIKPNKNNNFIKEIINLEKEIDESEIIKNINDIKDILKQATIIININDKEKEEKILFEIKMNQNLEDINYNEFKREILKGSDYSRNIDKYKTYNSLILKYKKLILFIEEIKKRAENKFPKDKFTIKLNIIDSNICEYYIFDELSDFEVNNKIYQDKDILYNKGYPGFNLFLDNIFKK